MSKRLAILIVVLVTSLSVHTASAQSTLYRDFASSPHEPFSESKRLYREGVKYALAGLYSQAVQIFQRVVQLDPNFADAHFALGHAYYDMGRWQNAIDSFQKAVDLNPRDLEAQDRLDQARDMLARKTGKAPEKKEIPKTQPAPQAPAPEPVAEQISLNAKPVVPATSTPTESAPADTTEVTEVPKNSGEAAKPNTVAADTLALTKLYRVGPGDVLDVRVNDAAAPQSTLFTVTPVGLLEHPLLAEPLHVGGLSVEEISAAFEADLKRRALSESPQVSVGVRDYASHTILVSGLVKDSGTKILRREAIPLYVVVADAQPLPEAARVTVLRSEANETYDIDLSEPSEMNLLVRPGDVISLHANTTQFLYVGGEVKSPGEKTYRRGLTLTQAILAAGGMTDKAKEARLGRDDGHGFLTVTRLRLKDIESGRIPDPMVRPGDRITIVK